MTFSIPLTCDQVVEAEREVALLSDNAVAFLVARLMYLSAKATAQPDGTPTPASDALVGLASAIICPGTHAPADIASAHEALDRIGANLREFEYGPALQ